MARGPLSFAGTVLSAFAVSACVLVASGTSNLQTEACGFQGQDTPCGACVLGSCLGLLNSCCTDSSCSSNLPYLDGCASGSAPLDCTLLVAGGDFGASASFIAFGSCIASHCASCTGGPVDAGTDALVKDATPPKDARRGAAEQTCVRGTTTRSVQRGCRCFPLRASSRRPRAGRPRCRRRKRRPKSQSSNVPFPPNGGKAGMGAHGVLRLSPPPGVQAERITANKGRERYVGRIVRVLSHALPGVVPAFPFELARLEDELATLPES